MGVRFPIYFPAYYTLVKQLPHKAPSSDYPESRSKLCECILDTSMHNFLVAVVHNKSFFYCGCNKQTNFDVRLTAGRMAHKKSPISMAHVTRCQSLYILSLAKPSLPDHMAGMRKQIQHSSTACHEALHPLASAYHHINTHQHSLSSTNNSYLAYLHSNCIHTGAYFLSN